MSNKRGQFWETLLPWIITIVIVGLMLFLYLSLSGKLGGMGGFVKNFLRFGR
jgi:hypothetical protein